jgi:hypothetical protein
MQIFKKLIILLPGILLSPLFQSCNPDNLDVQPVNEFLSENFYQTEEQVFSALVAAYDPLGWTMAYGQWISPVMFSAIRSDNANAGGDPSDNDQPGWQELDDFRNNNTNSVAQPLYRRNYIGIFRSNLVIGNVQINTPLVQQYQAEAKFLRAYYHFELFRHFGPIPIVTETLAPDQVNLERNTMSEVFESITNDLKDAIELLPITLSSGQSGRATKGAALALLGKAYLYWADMDDDNVAKFDEAADYLQQVVDLGIYELEDDMRSLYAFGFANPAESVFEIQQSNLFPSDWGWFQGIDGNGIIQLCGIRGLCADHPYIQEGWGFMLPTAELANAFLPDDAFRKDLTLFSKETLEVEIDSAGVTSCNVIVDETQSNPQDFTGYWQKKYINYKAYTGNNVNGGDPNLTKDQNIYAIRYADVLLMLAEALHRGSSDDPSAMTYINTVRERAAGPGDNTGNFRTAAQVMSEEGWTLLDLIWYERRVELAFEGDRWYDLVRSGRADANLFSNDPLRSGNFNAEDIWIPISLEELSVAPNLTEYPEASLFR